MKQITLGIIAFALLFSSCKGGDPNVPGETKENPLAFHVRDYMSGKIDPKKKTYYAIKGVPLTRFYSYTYKKKKYTSRKPTEKDAKEFYFPILPKNYDGTKDEIKVFVYVRPSKFKEVTKEMKEFIDFPDGEKTLKGRKKIFKVPDVILNVYKKKNIKVAPSDQILTVILDSIE